MSDWAEELTTKLLDNTPELKQVSLREIMASALRAERKRCADVAVRYSNNSWTATRDVEEIMQNAAKGDAADTIADMIMGGE